MATGTADKDVTIAELVERVGRLEQLLTNRRASDHTSTAGAAAADTDNPVAAATADAPTRTEDGAELRIGLLGEVGAARRTYLKIRESPTNLHQVTAILLLDMEVSV